MSKYIDADLIEYHDSFTNDGEYVRVAFGDDIDVLPTADVAEAVHGEWKLNNLFGFKIYDCSNCGIHMETRWNYCPHCGADMRGGTENE